MREVQERARNSELRIIDSMRAEITRESEGELTAEPFRGMMLAATREHRNLLKNVSNHSFQEFNQLLLQRQVSTRVTSAINDRTRYTARFN